MDPNETLRLYREARRRALALADGEVCDACEAFIEADEHMSNLLDWLGKGSFPPDWTSARFVDLDHSFADPVVSLLDQSGTD